MSADFAGVVNADHPEFVVSSFTMAIPVRKKCSSWFQPPYCLTTRAMSGTPQAIAMRHGAGPGGSPPLACKGVFDTGATLSAISSDLADRLSLPVVGRCPVATANGMREMPLHIVHFLLPNNLVAAMYRVTSAPLGECDFLLGMDVISQGDVYMVRRNNFLVLTFTLYFSDSKPAAPPGSPFGAAPAPSGPAD